MSGTIDLPQDPGDITAAWLDRAIRTSNPDFPEVTDVRVDPIGEGVGFVGRVCRLSVTYAPAASEAPASLVAKLHSDHPQNVRYWGKRDSNAYLKELQFYRDIAPDVDLRTPICWFGRVDWDAKRAILVFEDLGIHRPGDQLAGCTAEDTIAVARNLARFNAGWWESDRLDTIYWLPGYTWGIDTLQERFDQVWPVYLEKYADTIPSHVREIGDRMTEGGARAVREVIDGAPQTLCHGDFRLDNLFFVDDGTTAVIDWNGLRSGPGIWDLSHFVYQGLDPDVRRSCEDDVLNAYCDTLADLGIDYPKDRAWHDYRLTLLTHLQKLARGFASFELVNERHRRLRDTVSRRAISTIADHCEPEMVPV